jgi:hypothetical protein
MSRYLVKHRDKIKFYLSCDLTHQNIQMFIMRIIYKINFGNISYGFWRPSLSFGINPRREKQQENGETFIMSNIIISTGRLIRIRWMGLGQE